MKENCFLMQSRLSDLCSGGRLLLTPLFSSQVLSFRDIKAVFVEIKSELNPVPGVF